MQGYFYRRTPASARGLGRETPAGGRCCLRAGSKRRSGMMGNPLLLLEGGVEEEVGDGPAGAA